MPKLLFELAFNVLRRVPVKYASSLHNCVPLGITWSFAECEAKSFSRKEKKRKGVCGNLVMQVKLVSPEHACAVTITALKKKKRAVKNKQKIPHENSRIQNFFDFAWVVGASAVLQVL